MTTPKAPSSHDLDPAALPRTSARIRLRNYFLTGLIVAGPVAITLYITWCFIKWVDGWVKPLIPAVYLPETYLPFQIPGFGLIVALDRPDPGRLPDGQPRRHARCVEVGEDLLNRMPVVRGIYKALKQVFATVFSQSGTSFRKVGLVEFPGRAPGRSSSSRRRRARSSKQRICPAAGE